MTLIQFMRADFERVLAETGLSAAQVQSMTENSHDQMPMPLGYEHLRVAPSLLQGLGLFTDAAFVSGQALGPARIAGNRTPLGRYANHSPWPNTEFLLLKNGDLNSVALRDIPVGAEILNDYRQGARLWGATFNPEEVALTLQERDRHLAAIGSIRTDAENNGRKSSHE